MNIKNYKLKDFLVRNSKVIEEYIKVLRYVPSRETEKEVFHMKFKHVENIKENLNSNQDGELIKIISKVQGCEIEDVFEMPIIKFFGLVASVREQLDIILDAEERSLSSDTLNFKWEAVNGSERMSKFGLYNTLDILSEGDGLRHEEWLNEKYSKCFTVLLMKKTQKDLMREMDAIKTNN
jgi:hypothetical protein